MTKEEQKIKEISEKYNFNNLEGILKKAMDSQMGNVTKLKEMIEAHKAMSVPKATKTVKINGKDCVLALTQDGKVVITLASLDEAQKLFDEFELKEKDSSFMDIFRRKK